MFAPPEDQPESPQHGTVRDEEQQGAGVGGHVHDLGLGAGLEEGVAHRRDESDDQEGPGAGPISPS